jgi:hypothetical protein
VGFRAKSPEGKDEKFRGSDFNDFDGFQFCHFGDVRFWVHDQFY